jgi:thiamine biosynthesis lipoprotein
VRVPSPLSDGGTLSTVILRDTSLSTANLSEKKFVHDGRIYGAIMDPRTLRPAEGTLQVTVISPSATDSDALSNALFVSEPEDRSRLLEERRHDCALVIREAKFEREKRRTTEYETVRWPAEVTDEHPTELKTQRTEYYEP